MTPADAQALLRIGINMDFEVHRIRSAANAEQAHERLAELKERGRTLYRKAAFELHPDRTGGDPEKTELFKLLSVAAKALDEIVLRVHKPSPQPIVRQIIIQHHPFGFYGGGTSTTTTTANYATNVYRVVGMTPF
jgi:hypothetical protein